MSKNYWTVTYDHAQKIDRTIELEQLPENIWRVVIDDTEFITPMTTHASDFWGLVHEALTLHRNR